MDLLSFLLLWVALAPILLLASSAEIFLCSMGWWLLIKSVIEQRTLTFKFISLSILKTIGLIWATLIFAVVFYGFWLMTYSEYLAYFK